jgi:hypothetical protein
VFDSWILKGVVRGGVEKMYKGEIYDVYPSANIIRVI